MSSENKTFTLEEVAKHNTPEDAWIIISGEVYNVTKFARLHPGGRKVLLGYAGRDATQDFDYFHSQQVLQKYHSKLRVGSIDDPKYVKEESGLSEEDVKKLETGEKLGDLVPYGDPLSYQGWKSPYHNETHNRFRKAARQIMDEEVRPYLSSWVENQEFPVELRRNLAKRGFLQSGIKGKWYTEYYGTVIPGGIKPEEFDWYHAMICFTEGSRAGSLDFMWAMFAGLSIGLPPVLNFGSEELKNRVAKACATGEKAICLAITEPWGGSDVGNLKTTAKKTPCGKYYIVNGLKKWITNGTWADYFSMAVRTGGPGMKGISMLLIERDMPGVTTRKMNCQGMWGSGTAYVILEDVKVPVENLIGKEGKGFKYIMSNFNTERFGLITQIIGASRCCYDDAFKFACKRKTFGKRLIDHPVIRNKLANMIMRIEGLQAWAEQVAFQLNSMSDMEQFILIGGGVALQKAHATQIFEYVAREAVQIFGGLGYTRSGQGERVERLYRAVRGMAIPGGSEEIMLELGMKQAQKLYPTEARL